MKDNIFLQEGHRGFNEWPLHSEYEVSACLQDKKAGDHTPLEITDCAYRGSIFFEYGKVAGRVTLHEFNGFGPCDFQEAAAG